MRPAWAEGSRLPQRSGVIIGSGIGGMQTFEEQTRIFLEKGPSRVSPFFVPMFIPDIAAGIVSIRFGLKGPNYCTVSACASSAHAVGEACRLIQYGDADVDDRGRHRGVDHAAGGGGLRQHEGALDAQRRSRPRPPARSTATATASSSARARAWWCSRSSSTPRRAARRSSARWSASGMSADAYHITQPEPDGAGRAAARCGCARGRPRSRRRTSPTSTRTARRRRTATSHETPRRQGGVRRPRAAARDGLHQVDDRAPAGRGRGGWSSRSARWRSQRGIDPADDQSVPRRIPSAISTARPTAPSSARWTWRSPTRSASAGTTSASPSAALPRLARRTQPWPPRCETAADPGDATDALRPIAEKVLAGRAARPRGRRGAATAADDLIGLGALAERGEPRAERRPRLLRRQPAHQPDQRLRAAERVHRSARSRALPKEEGAYTRTVEEVLAEAARAKSAPTREFHIVGGLHPKLRLAVLRRHDARPAGGVPRRAHQGAHRRRDRAPRPHREGVASATSWWRSQDAGPHTLPGGGAEVFSTAVRATIADRKLAGDGVDRACTGRRTRSASRPTARCCTATSRPLADRVEHLLMLRDLQDETRRVPDVHPAGLPSRPQRAGRAAWGAAGTARPWAWTTSRTSPIGRLFARQHPARQDALADGDAVRLAGGAGLRLRRHRGHGRLRARLPRRRRARRRWRCRTTTSCG